MTKNAPDRSGKTASTAADRAEGVATIAVGETVDAANAHRRQAAEAIETTAAAAGRAAQRLPTPLNEYARDLEDRLETAADYVRDRDVREMADQTMKTAKDYPVVSLLVLGAVVVGGALLVATIVRNENESGAGGQAYFAATSNGLGPKATETVTRIRDAAFSMALAKAIDTIEELFPGFREHFDKA